MRQAITAAMKHLPKRNRLTLFGKRYTSPFAFQNKLIPVGEKERGKIIVPIGDRRFKLRESTSQQPKINYQRIIDSLKEILKKQNWVGYRGKDHLFTPQMGDFLQYWLQLISLVILFSIVSYCSSVPNAQKSVCTWEQMNWSLFKLGDSWEQQENRKGGQLLYSRQSWSVIQILCH